MELRRALVALLVASLSGDCAYEYGRRPEKPLVVHGSGWDSGIAYGDAVDSASGRAPNPAAPSVVEMNCYMYGLKPLAVFTGGALAAEAKNSGNAIAALGIAAVISLVPNCFATLTYDSEPPEHVPMAAPPQQPPPRKRPTALDEWPPLAPVHNKPEILAPPGPPAPVYEGPEPPPPSAIPDAGNHQ